MASALATQLALVVIALLLSTAAAQPFAAAGGFGRPVEVAVGAAPVVSVAYLPEGPVVVWADGEGVNATYLADDALPRAGAGQADPAVVPAATGPDRPAGNTRRIAASSTVRGVAASAAAGRLAVAWVERDRRTGATRHHLHYDGHDHHLFDSPQETLLTLGDGAHGPWLVAAIREAGEARLTVFEWRDGALERAMIAYATEQAVRGLSALDHADPDAPGPSHVAWLEGVTEMTPMGMRSEWNALLKPVDPAAPALDLGLADVVDERQSVALGHHPDGGLIALHRQQESTLVASRVEMLGGSLVLTVRSDLGELGRPIGWVGDLAFYIEGPFVRAVRPFAGTEPESVAWSPVLVADADVEAGADGGIAIAWQGRAQGGQVRVLASDDSAPIDLTARDRLAAIMGWSPWNVGQEAAGQALTAVLFGVVATMAIAPLLFVISVVVARSGVAGRRATAVGALVGVVTPPLLSFLAGERVFGVGGIDAVPLLWLVAILGVGALVAVAIARRGDREAQLDMLVAASLTALIGLTVWSFAFYGVWAPFIGL